MINKYIEFIEPITSPIFYLKKTKKHSESFWIYAFFKIVEN